MEWMWTASVGLLALVFLFFVVNTVRCYLARYRPEDEQSFTPTPDDKCSGATNSFI